MRHASRALAAAAIATLTLGRGAFAQSAVPPRAPDPSGGNGTLYVGTYARNILVVDEASFRVKDSIPVSIGIPYHVALSSDRKRIHAINPAEDKIEILDLASKKSLGVIALSFGNTRVHISSMTFDPLQRYALLIVKNVTKRKDRYEIGRPVLVKYDLARQAVTDTIKWPGGQERENAQILFSPKGDLLYFFTADGVLVWDAATFKQLETWDMTSMSLEEGLGRINFGFTTDIYEEPGFYTGAFRMPDPVNHRAFMGMARIDLANRKLLDYYTFGPAVGVGLRLAPGRTRAYGLQSAVGNYLIWAFDLENHRLIGKTEFTGRPRMSLSVSTNGTQLYIGTAGSTIDRYDAVTVRYLGTLNLGADMTGMEIVPAASPTPPR
jgi:hypothetical protein